MGEAYLVTGTDTGVGKTYFSYWSAKILISMNVKVLCIKPVETGVNDVPEDGKLLSEARKLLVKTLMRLLFTLTGFPFHLMRAFLRKERRLILIL